jgi:hypothetical protein
MGIQIFLAKKRFKCSISISGVFVPKMKLEGTDVVSRWNAERVELKQEAKGWKTQELNTVSTR